MCGTAALAVRLREILCLEKRYELRLRLAVA
jgi:hypothetical protein